MIRDKCYHLDLVFASIVYVHNDNWNQWKAERVCAHHTSHWKHKQMSFKWIGSFFVSSWHSSPVSTKTATHAHNHTHILASVVTLVDDFFSVLSPTFEPLKKPRRRKEEKKKERKKKQQQHTLQSSPTHSHWLKFFQTQYETVVFPLSFAFVGYSAVFNCCWLCLWLHVCLLCTQAHSFCFVWPSLVCVLYTIRVLCVISFLWYRKEKKQTNTEVPLRNTNYFFVFIHSNREYQTNCFFFFRLHRVNWIHWFCGVLQCDFVKIWRKKISNSPCVDLSKCHLSAEFVFHFHNKHWVLPSFCHYHWVTTPILL